MKTTPKLLLALVAVAGLAGCAVYPAPGYGPHESAGMGAGQFYAVESAPVYINGGVGYQRGYAAPPVYRSRRDRDGDGVPNRRDARPNNPHRR